MKRWERKWEKVVGGEGGKGEGVWVRGYDVLFGREGGVRRGERWERV